MNSWPLHQERFFPPSQEFRLSNGYETVLVCKPKLAWAEVMQKVVMTYYSSWVR